MSEALSKISSLGTQAMAGVAPAPPRTCGRDPMLPTGTQDLRGCMIALSELNLEIDALKKKFNYLYG